MRRPDPEETLAEPILGDGYSAVFVARQQKSGALTGRVFKPAGERPPGRTFPGHPRIDRSAEIHVEASARLPLRHSQELERVVMDCASNHPSPEAFQQAHGFHPLVVEFLGEPIRSFANYHEGDITVIAFNLWRADHR